MIFLNCFSVSQDAYTQEGCTARRQVRSKPHRYGYRQTKITIQCRKNKNHNTKNQNAHTNYFFGLFFDGFVMFFTVRGISFFVFLTFPSPQVAWIGNAKNTKNELLLKPHTRKHKKLKKSKTTQQITKQKHKNTNKHKNTAHHWRRALWPLNSNSRIKTQKLKSQT